MPFLGKLSWISLTIVTYSLVSSCQPSNSATHDSISKFEKSTHSIDTSLWLRETRGIRDILEDSKGNLWFSSPDYIAKYNGKDIQYFAKNVEINHVGNIHEDMNGTVWVEDGFTVSRFNGKGFVSDELDSSLTAKDLWIQRGLDPTDSMFTKPGLFQLNKVKTTFHTFPITHKSNYKYLYLPTTKAFLGKDSIVWVGTMEKVFGLKNNSFISIGREEMGRREDERQMGIRGIFIDHSGKLWIADNGAGLFVFNGIEVENFTKKHYLDVGDVDGPSLQKAFSIAEDDHGNMWFGTVYSGIWMYNPKTNEFANYSKEEGVMSDNIWTIYKTKSGELLFAGESPGAVYIFKGKTFDRKY